MKRFVFLLTLLAWVMGAMAQPQQLRNNLKMVVGGDTLVSAWSGAMNLPQFAVIDLDRDGKDDLMVFDRADNSITPYRNEGSAGQISYRYAPAFAESFAECNCTDWALTADYDCDGRMDIFCGNNSYVNVYRQGTKNGKPYFNLVYENLSSTYKNNFNLWIFSARVDLPAVTDMDGDGDIDLLVWKLGFNYIEYHQNFAQEELGRCDTLLLREATGCFGHFGESGLDNSILLNDTSAFTCPLGNFNPYASNCIKGPEPPPGGGTPGGASGRHIGSSTTVLDLDADGLPDLLIGDVSFNNINAVHNCGRSDYAYMDSVDDNFPSYDVPINMGLFPSTFYVDVDNDQVRDLIVAPSDELRSENKFSTQLYLNQGQDNYPDFAYQGVGFIQEETIDQGSGTSPAFFDHNGDGLLDLLVGDWGIYDTLSKISTYQLMLYENVGDSLVPVFELVDDDYLGLSSSNLVGITPTAGDLDGDQDDDLLLGTVDGHLVYYKNTAMAGSPATFSLESSNFGMIDVGLNSAPHLVDLDSDGDLDLLVGNQSGKIAYYKNDGSPTAPIFNLFTTEYGFVQLVNEFGSTFEGNAKPIVVDYDRDGDLELLVGGVRGQVEVYEELSKALTDTLPLNRILFDYDFGSYASPAAAVLDSTGDFTFIVGNERGGLKLFNSLPAVLGPNGSMALAPELKDALGISFFPNPADDQVTINWQPVPGKALQVKLQSMMGQQVTSFRIEGDQRVLSTAGLAPGLYLLQFQLDGKRFVEKLVLR